jgi:hypothetical protein
MGLGLPATNPPEPKVTLQLRGKSNSYVILVQPIQLLKGQRAPYPKKKYLFKGPQELNKTTLVKRPNY